MVASIWIRLALVGAVFAAPVAGYYYGKYVGDSAGYDRRVAEVAASNAKAELERKNDDAALAKMSDYDLCVSGMRAGGLSIDACEQLRGLQP